MTKPRAFEFALAAFTAVAPFALAAVAAGGCSSPGGATAVVQADAGPAALGTTADQWTWVTIDGALCDDGSGTGIGVYRSSTSTNLVVYLQGGGACWDFETCVSLGTSAHGPFGATEFAAVQSQSAGSVLDDALAGNPFAGWSKVFVPYCTGDVHSGDNVMAYSGAGDDGGTITRTIQHVGRVNVTRAITALAPTFPAPGKLVVSGSSAGGGGALFNYPSFRTAWPATPTFLVDDSLPLFVGDALAPALRAAWFASWNLGTATDVFCGTGCRDDMSLYFKAVAQAYPDDRLALLSSEQDATMRIFFEVVATQYQADLTALDSAVLAPTPNFRRFFVAGETHTMLLDPSASTFVTTSGVAILPWLGQMLGGDGAWASVGP